MVGIGAEVGIWIVLGTSDRLRLSGEKIELEPPYLNFAGCICSPGDNVEGVPYSSASFV